MEASGGVGYVKFQELSGGLCLSKNRENTLWALKESRTAVHKAVKKELKHSECLTRFLHDGTRKGLNESSAVLRERGVCVGGEGAKTTQRDSSRGKSTK